MAQKKIKKHPHTFVIQVYVLAFNYLHIYEVIIISIGIAYRNQIVNITNAAHSRQSVNNIAIFLQIM